MAVAVVEPLVEAVGAEVTTTAAEGAAAESGAGAADESALDGLPHGEHDVGGGHSMNISQAQIQALAHSPAVVAALLDRAHKCAEIANSLAITEGAKYDVSVQNRSDSTRARARVYAANFKAVVDEAYHSTLLKAAAQTGSDPRTGP